MKKGKRVFINEGNVEKALRKFKKKINEDGILQELQERQFYVKPTVQRKLAKSQAKNRWKRKLQNQQLPPKLF